jgi:hypothetical protein
MISRRLRKGPWHRRWGELSSLLAFPDTNVLGQACAQERKRRQQHPEPPALAYSGERQRERDEEKGNTQEGILERLIQR